MQASITVSQGRTLTRTGTGWKSGVDNRQLWQLSNQTMVQMGQLLDICIHFQMASQTVKLQIRDWSPIVYTQNDLKSGCSDFEMVPYSSLYVYCVVQNKSGPKALRLALILFWYSLRQ